jgi:hypothetical protein
MYIYIYIYIYICVEGERGGYEGEGEKGMCVQEGSPFKWETQRRRRIVGGGGGDA